LKEIYFEGFVPIEQYEIVKGKQAVFVIYCWGMSGKHRVKTWQTEFEFNLNESLQLRAPGQLIPDDFLSARTL
jgi:hypothetical protein